MDITLANWMFCKRIEGKYEGRRASLQDRDSLYDVWLDYTIQAIYQDAHFNGDHKGHTKQGADF